jgi:hypothetical protein
MSVVDRLPEALRNKLFDMLENPALTQAYIAERINDEAGKPVISRSALNRYTKRMEKITGRKPGTRVSSSEESLAKIAAALERIASSMEKRYKEPS